MKKAMIFAVALQIASLASAQTNLITLADLGTAKADWPKSVTTTTNISVGVTFGAVGINKGETLLLVSVSNGIVSVIHAGITNQIPAAATDIVQQINALRQHRYQQEQEIAIGTVKAFYLTQDGQKSTWSIGRCTENFLVIMEDFGTKVTRLGWRASPQEGQVDVFDVYFAYEYKDHSGDNYHNEAWFVCDLKTKQVAARNKWASKMGWIGPAH